MSHSLETLGAKLAEWPGVPRSVLELRVRYLLTFAVIVGNMAGGLVTLFFATWAIPDPPDLHHTAHVHMLNLAVYFAYPVVAGPIAVMWGSRLLEPVHRLVREGGVPDREQRRAVLLGPANMVMIMAVLWLVGAA